MVSERYILPTACYLFILPFLRYPAVERTEKLINNSKFFTVCIFRRKPARAAAASVDSCASGHLYRKLSPRRTGSFHRRKLLQEPGTMKDGGMADDKRLESDLTATEVSDSSSYACRIPAASGAGNVLQAHYILPTFSGILTSFHNPYAAPLSKKRRNSQIAPPLQCASSTGNTLVRPQRENSAVSGKGVIFCDSDGVAPVKASVTDIPPYFPAPLFTAVSTGRLTTVRGQSSSLANRLEPDTADL
ncbi:hypothetical protein V8E54_000020 [Elaphomyces granulatus]